MSLTTLLTLIRAGLDKDDEASCLKLILIRIEEMTVEELFYLTVQITRVCANGYGKPVVDFAKTTVLELIEGHMALRTLQLEEAS